MSRACVCEGRNENCRFCGRLGTIVSKETEEGPVLSEFDSEFDDAQKLGAPSDNNRSSFHAKLLDSLFDGVYFVDAERKITYWNRGSESLTGYSACEAVGKHRSEERRVGKEC